MAADDNGGPCTVSQPFVRNKGGLERYKPFISLGQCTVSQPYMDHVVVMSFLVGVILLTLSVLKVGFVTIYLSNTVIRAFTTGAAIGVWSLGEGRGLRVQRVRPLKITFRTKGWVRMFVCIWR